MTYLWIYPFKMGNHLEGFFIVTDINDSTRENEVHNKINRLTMVLFSYILNIRNLDTHELMYVDYVEPVMRRIERELVNAKNLRIPLTVILFSIKNFKRYYSLFGKDEAMKVLNSLEEIIRSRLADPDFSVRYDRNKFLIILPGKNKKYSIPLVFLGISANKKVNGINKLPATHKYLLLKSPPLKDLFILKSPF